MASPAEVVAEQFSNATSYANAAIAQSAVFINALANAVYTTPTFNVTWTSIDPPSAVTIPSPPGQLDTLLAQLNWDQGGDIAGSKPSPFTATAPSIVVDDFTEAAPVLDIPSAPTLDFGIAPVVDFGVKPTAPVLSTITLPDAPTIDLPSAPSFLSLSTPTFAGLDLHTDLLATLETLPTLTLAAPTPYTYSPGPTYTSTLISTLKSVLTTRLGGGTGLNPVVEQAIWDRERAREVQIGIANEAEVARTHEALGFHLPTGALAAQLRAAQQDSANKIATASRDVAIKQADLEQKNLESAVTAGIQLEGDLVTYSLELEKLAFENAKEVAQNSIDVHNAGVEKFKALLQSYQLFAEAYRTIIEAEKAKVEVYKAQLQAEETKANVNRTLVEQYRAQIEAQLSFIRIFEAQLSAAKVQVEIEQARVASFGEEIRAYVAGINGETSKVEAYKIGIEAQKTKVDVFDAGVRGQLARVQVYDSQARAFTAKASAQGEKARAQISYYEGVVRAKSAEWEGWSARVRGEAERFRALTSMSNAVLDGFKAKAEVVLKTADQDIRRWEIGIKQYEGIQNYTLGAQKLNTEVLISNRGAVLHAKEVGAQVLSQLAGSAMSMIHTSASVGASASDSVSYAYSNDTSATVPPVTTV